MPHSALIASGTKLFGATSAGGANGDGTIFTVGTDGNGFATLKSFAGTDGMNPEGVLVLAGVSAIRNGAQWQHERCGLVVFIEQRRQRVRDDQEFSRARTVRVHRPIWH